MDTETFAGAMTLLAVISLLLAWRALSRLAAVERELSARTPRRDASGRFVSSDRARDQRARQDATTAALRAGR